jgi:B-box zinc finger
MTEALPKMYCANHPNVETTLRCNRCEKPICTNCAVLTPTGYRCKECIKELQKKFDTALWYDYPLIFIVVGVLAYIGSLISARIGFFTILLAPAAGAVIAEAARRVTRKRRSRELYILAAIAALLGCLPVGLTFITHFVLWGVVWQVVYAVLMISAMFYRLSGIRIG